MERREFLRLAGATAVLGAAGFSCGGDDSDEAKAAPRKDEKASGPGGGERTLRIIQWNHFVPAYDAWFDNEYTKRWGEEHDVRVVVEHIPLTELPTRAAAEVAARRGHDLFQFTAAPSAFEDNVIDHRDLVKEVEAQVGPMTPHVERTVFNPRTDKYFGFSDSWVASILHYRSDVWDAIGRRPERWVDVLAAAPKLKAAGHPVGIGMSSTLDFDSSWSLMTLMHAYGASVQDEQGRLTLDSPATIEAVRLGASLYQTGMTEEILNWDSSSNNRYLASAKGSMILNAISAIRAVETQDPDLAAKIALLPPPEGPAGRHACYVTGVYVIWDFAESPELAQQFLVDFALASRESFLKSDFYNLPSFPGAVADLPQLVQNDTRAQPATKYQLLGQATSWSTNVGHPGPANAAIDEVFNQFLVSKMFAAAARGELTAEEAVKQATAQAAPIFDKWRERGKI